MARWFVSAVLVVGSLACAGEVGDTPEAPPGLDYGNEGRCDKDSLVGAVGESYGEGAWSYQEHACAGKFARVRVRFADERVFEYIFEKVDGRWAGVEQHEGTGACTKPPKAICAKLQGK